MARFAAVLEVRLPNRVGLEAALLALLGLAASSPLGLSALALLPPRLLAVLSSALLTARLPSALAARLLAILLAAHSLVTALLARPLVTSLTASLLPTLLTAGLLLALLAALFPPATGGLRLGAALSPTRFAAVLEVRVVAHVGFELAPGLALSLAAGLFGAAVVLVLPGSLAGLSLLTALFVLLRPALWRLLPALSLAHSLTVLPAALSLLAALSTAHPLVLLATLPVLLFAHSLAALLAALLGLALLTAPTLLVAHLLGTLPALWLRLLALVARLAAVLKVRLSDRVGLEPALLVSAAPIPLGLSALALLAAHLTALLFALRSLTATGLLAATLLAVTAGGASAVVRFAGGPADVFLRTVPLLRSASRSLLGIASRRAVRTRFLAAAAAVESVYPAAVVVVLSPLGLAIPIVSLGVARAVGASVSSVAVVSIVHGCDCGDAVVAR
ncbi:hypothetical protein Htur_3194 [Haloterrigena turkmenica DSM 5511]|uniref:Uncharacterized protein n=1 Tax=Haloterrigena turkmenica (strain ATCC 51198 / DSM 5511 / JCM 9101 / NCIMB 13204 / VKM B-1734 / 4k) TaxID=543526 RepID=D2RZM0_HALTV|nr:hypothetical protein Htur_3194 [Haloterrigena turkmenica DSM 5511]